jgi:tetratricopeptide (TPR) repeat protein
MKVTILISAALFLVGCNSASRPVANANSNAAISNESVSNRAETVIAHSTENRTAPIANTAKGKWTQSGEPIDTKPFDEDISAAENELKVHPKDESAKTHVGEAYYKRAVALTEARQYASALGDYRRALKYDPGNQQAKEWIDQIIGIYNDMGREYPPEGQEPPPLRINTAK